MTPLNDASTELFLLRVSAENDNLRVVVIGQRDQSRAAFSNLQSALAYIEKTFLKLTSCESK